MNQGKQELLREYIKSNVAPILLDKSVLIDTTNLTVLKANCNIELLCGHYEGIRFVPPKWYVDLKEKENEKYNFLIIEDLASVNKEEQRKFIEILKYRQVGIFKLPENCVILLTSEEINKNVIDKEIYSLVAHI